MTVVMQACCCRGRLGSSRYICSSTWDTCAIAAALSHPLSTGAVHITSPDPAVAPAIDYKYFSHPADLEIQARHVRYIEKIVATEPLAKFVKPDAERQGPAAHLNGDLDRAKELIRLESGTNYHSCGTCAMASAREGAVSWTSS